MTGSYAEAKIEVERLVERMLELYENLAAAAIAAGKNLYERQIEATDRQIDGLVHGLTEEEIGVVEGV